MIAVLRIFKPYLLAPMLLGTVVFTQYKIDRIKPVFEFLPPFVPPTAVIKIADLGMHSAAAGYMWLSAIQNFSANRRSNYGSIERYVENVNQLDPGFAYPYAFATLVMPEFGLVDEGIKIGMQGIAAVPDAWEVPFYTAMIYHDKKNDRISAAKLFDYVGHLDSTPDRIKATALNYGSAGTVRQQSRAIWESIYETTKDEIVLERARRYILHYGILDVLDGATAVFKTRYNKNPIEIQDLVNFKILKSIPEDPLGFVFLYDGEGRVRAEVPIQK